MLDFRELKENLKIKVFDNANYNELLNNLLGRFNYKLPMILDENLFFIELYLLTRGDCAFWELGKDWVITPCEKIGNIDSYGQGKDLFCVTLNGKTKTFKDFKNNDKVVYIKNNKLGSPDLLTEKDAQSLTEILTSIDCAVINTRFTDIITVDNEQTKIQMEKAIDGSQNGKPNIILSCNILDDTNGLTVHPLHDVSKTDVIQYLHRAYDDIIRRYWNRNGLEVCTSTKLAQQTADEVNSGHNARLVGTLEMLEERKKAIKKISKLTGVECSVELSELWKRELMETKPEVTEETEETEVNEEQEQGEE